MVWLGSCAIYSKSTLLEYRSLESVFDLSTELPSRPSVSQCTTFACIPNMWSLCDRNSKIPSELHLKSQERDFHCLTVSSKNPHAGLPWNLVSERKIPMFQSKQESLTVLLHSEYSSPGFATIRLLQWISSERRRLDLYACSSYDE